MANFHHFGQVTEKLKLWRSARPRSVRIYSPKKEGSTIKRISRNFLKSFSGATRPPREPREIFSEFRITLRRGRRRITPATAGGNKTEPKGGEERPKAFCFSLLAVVETVKRYQKTPNIGKARPSESSRPKAVVPPQ
jgi:hypothetical protein